jgi:phosphoglycolate phosphatase-like HAD superfamily hydrolase
MFGPAPVVDFDGTLARLGVDWERLRQRLHVKRIDDLWSQASDWSVVLRAEIRAATVAAPIRGVVDRLAAVDRFAVLTSNDSRAVHRFVDRFPNLKRKLVLVVGRTELGGPKAEFHRFTVGLETCLDALGGGTRDEAVYVGDSQFELDFARRLGLRVVNVRDVSDA